MVFVVSRGCFEILEFVFEKGLFSKSHLLILAVSVVLVASSVKKKRTTRFLNNPLPALRSNCPSPGKCEGSKQHPSVKLKAQWRMGGTLGGSLSHGQEVYQSIFNTKSGVAPKKTKPKKGRFASWFLEFGVFL